MIRRGHPYATLPGHAEMTGSRARRRGLRTGSGWDESPTTPSRSPGSSTIISSQEWMEKLTEVELDEEDVARLVLDYLQVTERSAAAAEFVVEAGLNESRTNNGLHHHHHQAPLTVSASSSTGYSNNGIDAVHLPPGTRAQIRRTLITDDDPVEAERMLHDLDPKILIDNPTIHVRLRIAQLVKLVGSTAAEQQSPAELLKFVQDKITPLVGSDDESTKQLEKAMMLITFGKNADNFPSEGDRCKLMEDLDVVILRQFDMSPTPLLTSIVKYMAMEQAKASESNGTVCVVPQLTDVGSATFSTVPSPPPMPTNGTTAGHGSATSREVIISDTSSDGGEAVPLATLLGRSSADDSSDADNQSSGD